MTKSSKMLPRQVQFTEVQWQALRIQAALEKRYTSDVIRTAVNEYLQRAGTRKLLDAAQLDGADE